jgi:hypothetical protein
VRFPPIPIAEARRLVERFEWHYTPKHGSWLDLAESELGVLSSQCLNRRIPSAGRTSLASWATATIIRATSRNFSVRRAPVAQARAVRDAKPIFRATMAGPTMARAGRITRTQASALLLG